MQPFLDWERVRSSRGIIRTSLKWRVQGRGCRRVEVGQSTGNRKVGTPGAEVVVWT